MKREFVPYELALKLKELGFDGTCFGWYENNELVTLLECIYPEDRLEFIKVGEISKRISAPTFSQCFKFFREKHNIDGLLHKTAEGSYYFWITECEYGNYNHYKYYNQMVYFNTYEEAEIACLENLIELVESKSE